MSSQPTLNHLEIHLTHSADETPPELWDYLSEGVPFASHRWQRFAEKAMTGCKPYILTAYRGGQPVARATFWKIPNEPLPVPYWVRPLLSLYLKHRPLLICRTAIANLNGFICLSTPLEVACRQSIAQKAQEIALREKCAAVVFDFVPDTQVRDWPQGYFSIKMDKPSMALQSCWNSMDEYLQAMSGQRRRHYKRTMQNAEKLGLKASLLTHCENPQTLLPLMRAVEQRFKSAPNPWIEGILTNLELVDGVVVQITQNEKVVGCGICLDDQGAQIGTGLGLAPNLPYVYLMMIYTSLSVAFSRKMKVLHWGSGAYDLKQHLGFEAENTTHIVVFTPDPILQKLSQLFR